MQRDTLSGGMEKGSFQPSWFRRNWKWIVAIWLSVCLLAGAIVHVAFNNSEAKRLAIAAATANPELLARLGRPIQVGWWITGSIEVTPGFGTAELAIPVTGPKGKGTVYALAAKSAGIWRLTFLQFGAEGDDRRPDLLETPGATNR